MPEVSGNLYYITPRSPTRQSFLLLVRSFSLSQDPMENQGLGFPLVQIHPARELCER